MGSWKYYPSKTGSNINTFGLILEWSGKLLGKRHWDIYKETEASCHVVWNCFIILIMGTTLRVLASWLTDLFMPLINDSIFNVNILYAACFSFIWEDTLIILLLMNTRLYLDVFWEMSEEYLASKRQAINHTKHFWLGLKYFLWDLLFLGRHLYCIDHYIGKWKLKGRKI